MKPPFFILLAVLSALALAATACGADSLEAGPSDDSDESTSAATTTNDLPDDGSDATGPSLGGICPETIVIQTDWNPESEHGMLYEMVGKAGYTIDGGSALVSGDLVAGGADTGVDIEVRSGGPAIGFQQVTSQLYQDADIHMGYVGTDEAIQNFTSFPTMLFLAPLEINPQMIMWDPETYPEVSSIADLATATDGGVIIRYFGTDAYMPDLVSRGIVTEGQLDGSYDGSPAVFVAEGGAIAQQGFASSEPYIYENEVEQWNKPVEFELIHDLGLQSYPSTIAATPAQFASLSDSGCLEALVPIMQQAQVDYIQSPDATNELIVELVAEYDSGWIYGPEVAAWSVGQQLDLGLVSNGPDATLGNFDLDRVQRVIDTLAAEADNLGFDIPVNLAPSDIVTNEFIDDSIGL